jgi:VIT1/CCC1 family predicted Fe2+/Mn2+ transporter
METTKKEAQESTRRASNLNWFVFGAVFFSVGMSVITGQVAWIVISMLFVFAFGMTTALVLGGKLAEKNADG